MESEGEYYGWYKILKGSSAGVQGCAEGLGCLQLWPSKNSDEYAIAEGNPNIHIPGNREIQGIQIWHKLKMTK